MQVLPAGKYFIGDPCYAFQVDGSWDVVLEKSDYFSRPSVEIDGKVLCAFSTVWGDGEYLDQNDNAYPVDAGLIGVVPEEIALKYCGSKEPFGMHLFEFKKDFECYSLDGVIVLGKIVIDTDSQVDEEEYYEDED